MYRTEITEGVEKAARRSKSEGREQEGQGPNFGGNMIVVQWSARAPGMEMAVVAAETGEVYFPPISFHGIGAPSFDLPLLTLGASVSRNPEIEFRLSSRLMIIKATPKQSEQYPSYTYYFLWQGNRWTLLKRIPFEAE